MGATSSATWVDEPAAVASVMSGLFLASNWTALKCLATLPMIGTMMMPTKNSDKLNCSDTCSTVPTSNSASTTVAPVAATSAISALRTDQDAASAAGSTTGSPPCGAEFFSVSENAM